MKKILIYKYVDVEHKTDYANMYKTVTGGECGNVGNKLWYQAIISEISTPENIIEYNYGDKTPEEINEKYDIVVYPMANIFSVEYISGLKQFTELLAKC